ncbi:MAG: response regulator transcription factor [Eubacteriales bacterium]|nr:response regulator transcription factor [Eubacteriales bacterium]
MERILVIEDDGDISRLLCRILSNAGYSVIPAFSGTEAQLRLEKEVPDLILLDLMLPGITGEELLGFIRNEHKLKVPVIILSAKSGLEDKVGTMTMGADDYITKPFEPEEVLVRVLAVLRRCRGTGSGKEGCAREDLLQYKNLLMKPSSRTVTVKEQEISLTNSEYDILYVLMEQPEKVFSRETLYEKVWKNGYYGEDNTVNVHVSNLRRKIAAVDKEQEYIKTVWGIGFKMS